MIELPGASAVSDFRIAKLRPALESMHPDIGAVTARYVHFVDLAARSRRARASAARAPADLRTARRPRPTPRVCRRTEIIVVPRFGTISPWSSKATDIAHVCGLDAVRRIERGIVWRIEGAEEICRATSCAARRRRCSIA